MPIIKCLICGTSKYFSPSLSRKYCSRICWRKSIIGKPTWNKGITKWMTKKHLKALIKGTIERNKKFPLSTEQARINGKKAKRQLILFTVHKHKEAVRRSSLYQNWRNNVFNRDNYTCQHCCKKGSYLQAHHLKSYSKYPSDRFKIENGITLCRECHSLMHF